MFFFSVECSYRKKGDQIADYGDSCDGKGYIPPRQDYRICLDKKLSGHLYYAQMLLQGCKAKTCCQASGESDQRYHPSFQDEDAPDGLFRCAQIAQCPDVCALFDDEHGKASEDVECNDDDDEDEDHVDGDLLISHHAV